MKNDSAFTLPELLIAIAIFSMVATLGSSLFIQSVHETRRANVQNQIYEDARYIMTRIGDEVRNGMIDYDEYYNQNVVIPYSSNPGSSTALGLDNFGQNYGRYYSSFFHPGNDLALGFDCNNAVDRNQRQCTPLRRTLDRHTGANPFTGKYDPVTSESAFCGTISYNTGASAPNPHTGQCVPPLPSLPSQNELYLISADGRTKTILALEKIANGNSVLSLLRLQGVDTNSDGISDSFVCAEGFECRGGNIFDVIPNTNTELNLATTDPACSGGGAGSAAIAADLPRVRAHELENESGLCDPADSGFSKDFVPISPFHVNIADLQFFILPDEDPHYAFSEGDNLRHAAVKIQLTLTHPEISTPVRLVRRVSSQIRNSIPAPLLVQ